MEMGNKMFVMTQSEKLQFGDIFEWALQHGVAIKISAYTTHTNVDTGEPHGKRAGFKVETIYFDHARSATTAGGWVTDEFVVHQAREVYSKLSKLMHEFWDKDADEQMELEEEIAKGASLEDDLEDML